MVKYSPELDEFFNANDVQKLAVKYDLRKTTKTDLLRNLFSKFENEAGGQLEYDLKQLMYTSLKFTKNRFFLTGKFEYYTGSPFYNVDAESEAFTTVDRLFDIVDLEPVQNELIFRAMDDNGTKLTLGYLDKFKLGIPREDSQGNLKEHEYYFLWVEFDLGTKEVKMSTSDYKGEQSVRRGKHARTIFQEKLLMLQQKYLFQLALREDDGLIFNLFNKLTENEELEYKNKVIENQQQIEAFVEQQVENLSINPDRTSELVDRTVTNFARMLIQDDYDDFLNKRLINSVAEVKAISYRDPLGASVEATSGGGVEDVDFELITSEVYFDTKDSINRSKKLSGIKVIWPVNPLEFISNATSRIEVGYRAYERYYITHFYRQNLSKEVIDNVLSRIENYRRID